MNNKKNYKQAVPFYKQAKSMLCFISGIGLLSLSAAGAIATDSSMDGLRLFYTDDERENAPNISSEIGTSVSDFSSTAALNGSMPKSAEPAISLNSENLNPTAVAVTFNAVIRNGEIVVLLLNDLPCESHTIDQVVSVVDVECSHVSVASYTFRYDLENATLVVYASRKIIGRLSTGDAL